MTRKRAELPDPRIAHVAETCTCSRLRMAARAVTQAFDAALAESGLKATQFTVLVAVGHRGPAPLSRLAEALVLDRTTLTRNLRPLERDGLIATAPGADRRRREIRLTAKGRKALDRALPLWEQAQDRMLAGLGRKRWQGLIDGLGLAVSLGLGAAATRTESG
jgi:DNA-binding MarR family transcriptional regulator